MLPRLLMALLLSSSIAAADDACLGGASTLADQRDLVAFRSALETACPCAAATKRGHYQHCGRAVVHTTIDAGDLRAVCKDTAIAIVKGATCGSRQAACGRYQASATVPRTCHVTRAKHCVDHRNYQQHACSAESFCADVVAWTASTCTDVRENGPFVPGARVVTLTRQTNLTYCT